MCQGMLERQNWHGMDHPRLQPCLLPQAADDSRSCSEGVAEEEAVARAADQKKPGTKVEKMCKVLSDPRGTEGTVRIFGSKDNFNDLIIG